jgi:hypothetical protein
MGQNGSITLHDALCTHVFLWVRRLDDDHSPSRLALSVNLRRRLGLPTNLVGNLLDFASACSGPDTTARDVALALRTSIVALSRTTPTYHAFKGIADSAASRLTKDLYTIASIDPIHRTLFVTSWANFGLYDLTFEASPPDHVYCAPVDRAAWVAVVMDQPLQAGLLVRLWLPAYLARRVRDSARIATEASDAPYTGASAS